jgi:hypothetical protein
MDRDRLLRSIAETGYNVGFGAKKTFATYDIVEKMPGWIGLISFVIGLFGLVFDSLAAKVPSALLLSAGVAALYISFYKSRDYDDAGVELTKLFNRLRNLYRTVQAGGDVQAGLAELSAIEADFYKISVSKQIFLSDWFAHYKFFSQMQIDWLDEQLSFRFWSDKVPLSARVALVLMVAAIIGFGGYFAVHHWTNLCL